MAKYAKTMGGRIVESREAMGLSQKELAKLIGVSSAVMSHWELDENKPNAERIVQLCKVLNITASYLLDYYGKDMVKVTRQEEGSLSPCYYVKVSKPLCLLAFFMSPDKM